MKRKRIEWRCAIGIVAIGVLTISPLAMGQPVPSRQEMVDKLKGTGTKLQSRGILVLGGATVTPDVPPPGKIDLTVNFDYNSATLTTDAELLLDRLAAALVDPALAQSRFEIGGHTDAAGGSKYNLSLSTRRAQSVIDYLVQHHGIAANRLTAVGYGSSRLLDADHPNSDVNRRVEITNLGA